MKNNKKVKYLSNGNMLNEFAKSKELGKPTNDLIKMYYLLLEKISKKHNFATYSYLEDMQGRAVEDFVMFWNKFNPEKSTNIFSYYTTIIHNAFYRILNDEKKHRNIRDALRISMGDEASWSYKDDENGDDYVYGFDDMYQPDNSFYKQEEVSGDTHEEPTEEA